MAIVNFKVSAGAKIKYQSVPFTEDFEIEIDTLLGAHDSTRRFLYSQWFYNRPGLEPGEVGTWRLNIVVQSGRVYVTYAPRGNAIPETSHDLTGYVANSVNRIKLKVTPNQYISKLNGDTPKTTNHTNGAMLPFPAGKQEEVWINSRYDNVDAVNSDTMVLRVSHYNIVSGSAVAQKGFEFWHGNTVDPIGYADVLASSGDVAVRLDSTGTLKDYTYDDVTGVVSDGVITYTNRLGATQNLNIVAKAETTDPYVPPVVENELTEGHKVIVFAGQSNMVGRAGSLVADNDLTTGTYPIGAGRVSTIGITDPALRLQTLPLDHWDETSNSLGLGGDFLRGVSGKVLTVPCAKGGTMFAHGGGNETWSWDAPAGQNILYNTCRDRIINAMSKHVNNTLDAFLWLQGEGDASLSRTTAQYLGDINGLRNKLIEETAMTIDTLWIVFAIVGGATDPQILEINNALQQFAESIPNGRYIDNIDPATSQKYGTIDGVHYDAAALRSLGTRAVVEYDKPRVVTQADTTKPVITLNKYTETITVGDPWTPPVATVTDNVDTGLTATPSGTIDHTTVGNGKTITYTASDAAGNAADPVTYTLNVLAATPTDTTKPVITLNGANPQTVIQGDVYTDLTATVTDNTDATRTINGDTTVSTATVGTFTVDYNATDAAGNVALTVTRTVNVIAAGSEPLIYKEIEIAGSLDKWIDNGTEIVHKGDTIKIMPSSTDNANQALTIGVLSIEAFGQIYQVNHGSYKIIDVPNDAMPKSLITIKAVGPNGGDVVVATKTLKIQ